MLCVRAALLNPAFQYAYLFRGECAIGRDRRHPPGRLLSRDAFDNATLLGMIGNECRAFAADSRRTLEAIESQFCHPLSTVLPMAVEAVLRQNRPDIATVVNSVVVGATKDRANK